MTAARRPAVSVPGLLVLGLTASLAACLPKLPGGGEPPRLFVLTPKSTFRADLPKVDWQLIIEVPAAAASLDTTRIALRHSPTTLEYYANVAWVDRAPAMVQSLLVESFENTGRIVAVGRESVGLRADYSLKTDLREFQVEYDSEGTADVRVRINAKLVKMPERTIIANLTAERVVPAGQNSLEDIVGAFDSALGKVLKQIVEWALTAPEAS